MTRQPISFAAAIRDIAAYDLAAIVSDNDMPADPFDDVASLTPMRPDNLDVIHMDNESINEVAQSAIDAEDCGDMPRMEYRLTKAKLAEGDITSERR